MSLRFWALLGACIFSWLGSYLPALWGGDSGFSAAGIVCSTIGGLFGIWAGFKAKQMLDS